MDEKIKRRKPVEKVFNSIYQLRINAQDKENYLSACQALGLDHNRILRIYMQKIAATNIPSEGEK